MAQPIEWELRPDAVIGAACGVLLLPLPWLGAIILAAAVHEGCHIAALRLAGGTVHRVIISLSGALMETGTLKPGDELICAAAGPAGSLLLLCAAPLYPQLAVCGLIQGCWNLLPLYPLDGGRILSVLLWKLCPKYAEPITWAARWIVGLLLLILLCRWAIQLPFLWFAAAFAGFRLMRRKISCNQPSLAVQ